MPTISAVDLRRWERALVANAVTLALNADKLKSDTFAATLDVSLSGVGARTTLALVPSQGVAIVITGPLSQTIPARVVWVRKDESSNSTIAGLKFLLY